MIKTSEYVSLGHPDKVADYISSFLLDEYLRADPAVRYAVEVQIKDNWVSLAGEVTSSVQFSDGEIRDIVARAVRSVGYTREYAKYWGAENALNADELDIALHIGQQSPDVAQGVNRDGWGDQGIFWGMACRETRAMLPRDYFIAKVLGDKIYKIARECGQWGLDIKTQVTLDDGVPVEVVAAVPCLTDTAHNAVHSFLRDALLIDTPLFTVNGTGRYVRHSSWGDCGTTGRKLAVDFYGGNCRIGGGSPWTKDGSKADVALNLLARKYALKWLQTHPDCPSVYVSISCCIGSDLIRVSYFNAQMREVASVEEVLGVSEACEQLGLRKPIYADMCRNGLFSLTTI